MCGEGELEIGFDVPRGNLDANRPAARSFAKRIDLAAEIVLRAEVGESCRADDVAALRPIAYGGDLTRDLVARKMPAHPRFG